tara:strand:+ start:121 stop:885 length:765 start_codon:yes stop_codon:yes gene_type:complete
MVYKYASVYNIVEKLYRDYEHQSELAIWDIIEWSGEALEFIGAGQQYELRVAELDIKNAMAVLPCNFHSQPQAAYNGQPMSYATGSFSPLAIDGNQNTNNVVNGTPVDPTTFPTSANAGSGNQRLANNYYIADGVFVTNIMTGTVVLQYRATKTDDKGYPMIPDLQSYRTAITKYCQMMMDTRDARKGRIGKDWAQKSESDWQWYCGQARGEANMPNLVYAEAIKNQWVRLKPNQNAHDSFYQDATIREMKKLK